MVRHRCILLALALLCALVHAPPAGAQDDDAEVEGTKQHPLEPPDTSSPRATFKSFLSDANAAWHAYLGSSDRAQRAGGREPRRYVRRAARTLDLSQVPPAQLEELSVQTVILLLDVFNRIPFPALRNIPNAENMADDELTRWALPHTNIVIAQIEEGPREGEWLFTPQTVERAREFYRRTRRLPLKPGAVIEDGFEIYIALPGWMIPVAWVDALPSWAHTAYLEQTLWQWVLVLATLALAVYLARLAVLWSRLSRHGPGAKRTLLGPASLVLLTTLSVYLIREQYGVTGTAYFVLQTLLSGTFFFAAAWGVLRLGSIVAEAIIASPHIRPGSVDGHLVRLSLRILSFLIGLAIVFEGLRSLGVPVVGVIAGLGVGGLAVALAAQSTIENFIGSLTIFADRPVRVGDFCRFGDQVGTVEQIGLRSTRIRTLDRSLLTVPNAEFSRLKLDNLSERDRILFRTKLNLRLETSSDQLGRVLERLRALLLDHPRVDPDPARVRVIAVGPRTIDLEVFAYITTSNYNEFLGIREELYLSMIEAVERAGTSFAPPASTTHLAAQAAAEDQRPLARASGPG